MSTGFSLTCDDDIIKIQLQTHLSDQSFMELCDRLEAIYTEISHPFTVVIDVSLLEVFGVDRRRRLADLEEKYRHIDKRYNRGQVFVVRNPLIRGAVTAIQWVSKPIYPVAVVDSLESAMTWARGRLRAQEQPTPR